MTKAINSSAMRRKNEKMILSIINRGSVSRADIAKETGLTKAAVTIIVDDLVKRGIIGEKSAEHEGNVGRTPVMLHINKEAVLIIGINITRRDITVGLSNLGGEIISEKTFNILPPEEAFYKIKLVLEKIITECNISMSDIYKIGLVTPGPVDITAGKILNPPNFAEWHNISVVDEIKKISGIDVCFENVSNGTALAEKYFGSAGDISSFISLQIDDGIGSGIIINNSLFSGLCELGHVSIKYDGVLCECGNIGCLEKYASIPALLKNTPYVSWKDAVDSNDLNLISKEAAFIKTTIISVSNIFGLDAVVLCGELLYKPDKVIKSIQEKLCGRMLSGKELLVCAGCVTSKTLIAASVAVGHFLGLAGV